MGHSLLDWIGYWAVKSIAYAMNLLPLPLARAIGRCIGAVCYYCHKRRHVAYSNLKAAFGGRLAPSEMKRIAKKTYINIAENAVEIFRFPRLDTSYRDTHTSIDGHEKIKAAVDKGKGLIFLTAHFGNWELLAIYSALIGYPIKVLVREQKYSRLNDLLNEFRSTHGNEVIGKGMAIREIMQALKKNEIVGILSDQSGGSDGVYVDFFGRDTTTPPGAISIALRTGCTVLPAFMIRKARGRHHVCIEDPLTIPATGNEAEDVRAGLRNYLQILERYITKYPEQWLWGHKRWKHTLHKSIIVLQDEKAGHRSQLKAVLDLFDDIAREKNFIFTKTICDVVYKSPFHRAVLFFIAPLITKFIQGRLTLLRYFLTPDSYAQLAEHYADIIISCGASTTPLSVLLKYENLAKNVVLMKPPFPYDLCAYDVMIVPAHDRIVRTRKNIIQIATALSPTTAAQCTHDGAALKSRLGITHDRVISFLIGGDTKDYVFRRQWFEEVIDTLQRIAAQHDVRLLITTSRRTRADIIDTVKTRLAGDEHCPLLVIPTEKNIENIVSGMLGAAKVVLITEDSVSMISEGIRSGSHVMVMPMAPRGMARKHQRFQQALLAAGRIRRTTHTTLSDDVGRALAIPAAAVQSDDEKQKVYKALELLV